MAKSLRSKREKRLRAIRREIVEKEAVYDKKEVAKLAAQQSALDAPKLPVRSSSHLPAAAAAAVASNGPDSSFATPSNNDMDVDNAGESESMDFLKPAGGVGKKFKRKFKVGKCKRQGKNKGNARRNRHI